MPPTIEHRPRPPTGSFVLLAVAGLFYALMLAILIGGEGADAAGRGLNEAFAAVLGLLLWIVLAVLLVIAGVRGRMPLLGGMGAALLLPATAVGAIAAIDLHVRHGGWPVLVVTALPPLIAFYALWARLPQFHGRLPPLPTSAFAGLAAVVLTALPLAARWQEAQPDPVRTAQQAADQRLRREEEEKAVELKRAQEAAAFAKLGPHASLGDYLPYLRGEHARQALTDIRIVKTRQADAIALLRQGRLRDLSRLREFNLEPTPELCQAYGAALGAAAAQVSPQVRSDYLTAAIELEAQLPNIRWLVAARCDLQGPLATLETNIRAVAGSERMTKFADTLATLRPPR
jgi:hypothetical protein